MIDQQLYISENKILNPIMCVLMTYNINNFAPILDAKLA